MALKARCIKTSMGSGEGDDPQIAVWAEVYEDVTGQRIADQVFWFSAAGIAGKTDAQKRALVRDAVLPWATAIKANAANAAPILTLVGASVDIPDPV